MSTAEDDLSALLVQQPTQAVRYGQGVVLFWDPETFENLIEWRGIQLSNLPVLSGTDALTYQAGDTVGMLGWDAGGKKGGASWWILGRLVVPGTGAAEKVIAFMTSELARQISAQIFADRVTPDFVIDVGTTATEDAWTDLVLIGTATPSPGPEVVANISPTGRAIVITNCGSCVTDTELAMMGFVIDGAASPLTESSIGRLKANGAVASMCGNLVGITLVEGLTEGPHTFTAKYLVSDQTPPGATWGERSMIVIGL